MLPFEAIALGWLTICPAVALISVADGKPTPNLTSLIVLGQDATDTVPYIVSIQYQIKQREWSHFCGGSIISSNFILTAAHCLFPHYKVDDMKLYRVLAGRNNLRSRIGSRHRIVSFTSHPKYKYEFNGYDIAVIKVHPKFKFNQKTISKIEFESSERVLEDIPVVFHGWGYTNFGYPDRLQEAYFTTLSAETCKSEGYDNLISTDMCVISTDLSVPYVGDSGGPLVNEEQTLQIGICSYGFVYFNVSYPTVFTRVSEFSKWIKDKISN